MPWAFPIPDLEIVASEHGHLLAACGLLYVDTAYCRRHYTKVALSIVVHLIRIFQARQRCFGVRFGIF